MTTTVKRYDSTSHSFTQPPMEECADGDYVRFSDYATLCVEVERLRAAHDHQYNMAGLLLREAERYGRENERLRAAFLAWWLDHHDDARYFNELMHQSPELAAAVERAVSVATGESK